MTFEIGKHYRSRAGEKWRVVALDASEKWPMIAVISGFRVSGYTLTGECGGHPTDSLLTEWIEPPVVNWPAMPAWAMAVALAEQVRDEAESASNKPAPQL